MRKIKKTGDKITLQVLQTLYKTKLVPVKDNRGRKVKDDVGRYIKEEQRVFFKQATIPMTFSIDGVTFHAGTLTNKGVVAKTRCLIYDRNTGNYYTVNHSPEAVLEAISSNVHTPIGFLGHLQQSHKSNK